MNSAAIVFSALISVFIHQVCGSLPYLVAPRSDAVSQKCKVQSEIYVRSLLNLTEWAAKMYDSSAKIPHGIIVGNNYHLGNFDECINSHVDLGPRNGGVIDGQYCLVRFQLGTDEAFNPPRTELETDPFQIVWDKLRPSGEISTWKKNFFFYGTCVPSSCTADDVLLAINDILGGIPHNGTVTASLDPATCQTKQTIQDYKTQTPLDSFVKFFFSGLAILAILSTAYDFILYRTADTSKSTGLIERIFMCFSARKNVPDLIIPKRTTEGFDLIFGTRTLFTILVVYGHRWRMTVQGPLHDVSPFEQKAREFNFMTTCLIVVNSFLSISGFLTGYLFYPELEKREEKNKLSPLIIVQPIIYRILRFTPLYAAVILLNLSVLPKIGDGPLWPTTIGKEAARCQSTWWTNLLYINNYYRADDMCIYQSWYLATDLQLFLLAMVLLYITKKNARLGHYLFGLLIVGSMVWQGVLTAINKDIGFLPVDEQTLRDIPNTFYYITYYIPTHFRMAPYLLSTLVGYCLYKLKDTPVTLSRFQTNLVGMLLFAFIMAVKESANFIALLDFGYRNNETANGLYAALHSPLWSLGFSLIIALNFRKTFDIAVNVFNSYPFLMINKLSFSVYLIHSFLHSFEYASLRSPKVISRLDEYWLSAGDIVYTHLFAFVLCLLVEMPSSKLVKILFSFTRPAPPVVESNKTKEETTVDGAEIMNGVAKNNGVIGHVINSDDKLNENSILKNKNTANGLLIINEGEKINENFISNGGGKINGTLISNGGEKINGALISNDGEKINEILISNGKEKTNGTFISNGGEYIKGYVIKCVEKINEINEGLNKKYN